MKKGFLLPLSMLLLSPTLAGCDLNAILIQLGIKEAEKEYTPNVLSITVTGDNTVKVGSTIKLTAIVDAEEGASTNVVWVSSDPTIATVDENGNIKGVSEGKVVISVSSEANPELYDHITIEVKKNITREILIEGEFNKKVYNFDDESFDPTGVIVKVKSSDGNVETLNKDQYSFRTYPEKPRGFSGNVMAVVTVSGLGQKTATFTDIKVKAESYDSTAEANAYYQGLSTVTLKTLQQHSFDKQHTYVTYGSIFSYYKVDDNHRSIEEIPGSTYLTNKFEAFYTGAEYDQKYLTNNKNDINKEHVWACNDAAGLWSHNGANDVSGSYKGGGADLYHLRMCDAKINVARGDAYFTELSSNYKTATETNGKYGLKCSGYSYSNPIEYSNYVEPADEMKGDYARIIAYVYMHYGNHGYTGTNSEYTGNLSLNQVISISGTKYSSIKALLVAWNNLDPVSETEKYRNHTVEKIQGNRNPFVDHPEWISQVL